MRRLLEVYAPIYRFGFGPSFCPLVGLSCSAIPPLCYIPSTLSLDKSRHRELSSKMAFHVFNNNEEGAAFVVAVIAIPICFFATLLRFVSTVRSARTIGAEDWFALVALLTFLVYTSIDLWSKFAMELMHQLFHILSICVP